VAPSEPRAGRRATSGGPAKRRRPPHDGVYARIGLSRIHGVGVRAIRDIPAGTLVFRGEDERVVWVSRAEIRRLPPALRQLYNDFAMAWGDRLGVPRTLNMLSVGWYLNHSDRPNVEADEDGRFHSLRRIRKGEELTADYRTFSDDRLTFRPRAGRRAKPATARRLRRSS
jgi:SET domain-containing protein